MIGYIVLCVLCMLFSFFSYMFSSRLTQRSVRILDIIVVFVFALIMAFKPEEMPDYWSYYNAFIDCDRIIENISIINLWRKYANMEIGFIYICLVFKSLVNSYRLFCFCVAFFVTRLSTKYLAKIAGINDNSREVLLLTTTYLAGFGVVYAGIAIRAGIAITLGIIAVYATQNKKIIAPIFLLSIAFLIHRSSIIYVLFVLMSVFFFNGKHSKRVVTKKELLFSFAMLLAYIAGLGKYIYSIGINWINTICEFLGLNGYIASYTGESTIFSTTTTSVFILIFITLILYSGYKSETELNNFSIFTLFVVIGIIFVFGTMTAASRLYDMALIFSIALIYQIIEDNTGIVSSQSSLIIRKSSLPVFLAIVLIFFYSFKTAFITFLK